MKTFKNIRNKIQPYKSSIGEDAELAEAIKLNSKVKIHAPGKDYHGKVGHVGEIRKGLHDKAPKTYTVDYDYDTKTGNKKSIQLDKSQLKMYNEEAEIDEASPMIKPPKNEFAKKEDAFAHAKQHGGKVMKKTFTHPTSGMKTVSYVVKEDAELDEAIKKPNATTRFLRQYPVSDKEMAKPITYYSLVHKATNKVLSTHKDLESAKDEHRGMDQGERAHYRIATTTKAPKSFSMKEDAEGVAEGYTGRETKDGTWHVFKDGQAVAVAGPFKSRDEAHAWKQRAQRQQNKVQQNKDQQKSKQQGVAEAGPFSYGAKPPRKGSVAYNALMKRKEQDKKRVKEIEAIGTKNHHIGVAKVTKEDIEDVAETYKYIDQSGGQVIKGKSGTYVGYTHSATKGKGANILKHNATKKYYAAGGSSTAFTQKTTLHDTPQAAARAYHKGNLAEQDEKEAQEYDYEGDMARSDLRSIINNAQEVHDMLEANTNLPEWVQSKITLAEDYVATVRNYMKSENMAEANVWDKPSPNKPGTNKMTPDQRAEAKKRAKAAGRPYPNLVDNMAAMK